MDEDSRSGGRNRLAALPCGRLLLQALLGEWVGGWVHRAGHRAGQQGRELQQPHPGQAKVRRGANGNRDRFSDSDSVNDG